jgi:hypothetical protein
VVDNKVFAGRRVKALPVFANTIGFLFAAGLFPEVGCGAAHVMDIALELRVTYKRPDLV